MPLLYLIALFAKQVDQLLIGAAMILVSFVSPIAIVYLVFQLLKTPQSWMRGVLGLLCLFNLVIFAYLLSQKAFIWQWWLFP